MQTHIYDNVFWKACVVDRKLKFSKANRGD